MSDELDKLFFDPNDEQSFNYSDGYIKHANANKEEEKGYYANIFLDQFNILYDSTLQGLEGGRVALDQISTASNLDGFKFLKHLKDLKDIRPEEYNVQGFDTYGRDRIYRVIEAVYDLFMKSRTPEDLEEIRLVKEAKDAANERRIDEEFKNDSRNVELLQATRDAKRMDAKKRNPPTLNHTIQYEPYQEGESEGESEGNPESKRRRFRGGSRRKIKRRRVKSTRGRHRRHNKSTRRRRRKY